MGQFSLQDTFCDAPERSSVEEIHRDIEFLRSRSIIRQMLDGYPDLAVILDWNRQIVAYNNKAERLFKRIDDDKSYGKRFGEALHCANAVAMPAGCGTSVCCRNCAVADCIRRAGEGRENCSGECRITIENNGVEHSLDLEVYSSYLNIDEKNYLIFSIKDIAGEKRKDVLEKIFFHDVLNTATAILGITDILPSIKDRSKLEEFSAMLGSSAAQLVQEIRMQQSLKLAENGKLSVNPKRISVNSIISQVFDLYAEHQVAANKTLLKSYLHEDVEIVTDATLLVRSLGNLLKNALEAVSEDETVKIEVRSSGNSFYFDIFNDGVMPEYVQQQIFQRSFSTKCKRGRGIGTYSVKLIVEKYLRGHVSFISDEVNQTCFTIEVPMSAVS